MEERRPPAVLFTAQPEDVSVPPHPNDDRAEAAPRVEPGVNEVELGLPALHAQGGEGGDEEGAATVGRQARHLPGLSQTSSFVTAETSDPVAFIDGQLQLARTKGFVTTRSASWTPQSNFRRRPVPPIAASPPD